MTTENRKNPSSVIRCEFEIQCEVHIQYCTVKSTNWNCGAFGTMAYFERKTLFPSIVASPSDEYNGTKMPL